MSINGADFYQSKVSQFKMQASHRLFMNAYIRAVNNAQNQIGTALNLSTRPDDIDDVEADIDIASDRSYALDCGVDYWLVRFGHKSGDLDLAMAERNFNESLADIRSDRDFDTAAADDDGNSIASLE